MSSDTEDEEEESAMVFLNLYDLTPLNRCLVPMGSGMLHSGIEVHGLEVAYGGRDSDESGVFFAVPQESNDNTFACSVEIGKTHLSKAEIIALVQDIQPLYKAKEYDVLY